MTQLKRIMVAELRLGMFLHGFDQAWIKHPFWTSRFLIKDEAILQAAWNCGIDTC
jgi:hypothetical protein